MKASDIFLPALVISAGLIFAILAGLVQYFQTKMLLPQNSPKTDKDNKMPDFSQVMQKQMVYFFPIFTVIILINLPSALGLYWTISGLFSIGQQYLIFKKSNKYFFIFDYKHKFIYLIQMRIKILRPSLRQRIQ